MTAVCPSCGADLTKGGAVRRVALGHYDEDGDLITDDVVEDCCNACDYVIS